MNIREREKRHDKRAQIYIMEVMANSRSFQSLCLEILVCSE
jgi:hypothetical protein